MLAQSGRKRTQDKKKTDKKGDGSHLLDLDEVLETNKSSSTLIVSSSTVMFIQIASESRVWASCCDQSWNRLSLKKY